MSDLKNHAFVEWLGRTLLWIVAVAGAVLDIAGVVGVLLWAIHASPPPPWWAIALTVVGTLGISASGWLAARQFARERDAARNELQRLNETGPSIEIGIKHENAGNDHYIEVRNTGKAAKFQAEIVILLGSTPLAHGKKYLGYWDFAKSYESEIINQRTDRIKIGSRQSELRPTVSMWNRLFYYDVSTRGLQHLDSESYVCGATFDGPNGDSTPMSMPSWTIQVLISSNPEMRESPIVKTYHFSLSTFVEALVG